MQFNGISGQGIADFSHADESEGVMVLKRLQDVSPYLERNKYLRNHVDWRASDVKGDVPMRLAASIPNIVIEEWLNRFGINAYLDEHWPQVQRLLNGEYKWLKTFEGRI